RHRCPRQRPRRPPPRGRRPPGDPSRPSAPPGRPGRRQRQGPPRPTGPSTSPTRTGPSPDRDWPPPAGGRPVAPPAPLPHRPGHRPTPAPPRRPPPGRPPPPAAPAQSTPAAADRPADRPSRPTSRPERPRRTPTTDQKRNACGAVQPPRLDDTDDVPDAEGEIAGRACGRPTTPVEKRWTTAPGEGDASPRTPPPERSELKPPTRRNAARRRGAVEKKISVRCTGQNQRSKGRRGGGRARVTPPPAEGNAGGSAQRTVGLAARGPPPHFATVHPAPLPRSAGDPSGKHVCWIMFRIVGRPWRRCTRPLPQMSDSGRSAENGMIRLVRSVAGR